MKVTIIALFCCALVGSALAMPYPGDKPDLSKAEAWTQRPGAPTEQRFLLDGGYNKDKNGHDIWAMGQVPVYTNGNHEVDLVGKYGQHVGGPWGNSPPSWGAGGNYRFRF